MRPARLGRQARTCRALASEGFEVDAAPDDAAPDDVAPDDAALDEGAAVFAHVAHVAPTLALVRRLNPAADMRAVLADAAGIGYPVA